MSKLKKRADGRYQRKITLSNGKVKVVYGKTLAELNAAEDSVRAEDNAGLTVGDHTLVGEWAKLWISNYKSDIRASTKKMYRDAYNLHIMPLLGSLELRDVQAIHIKNVMSAISTKSDSLQSKVLLTMNQLFKTAIENNLLVRNPCTGIKIAHQKRPQKKQYLDDTEADAFMQSITDDRARVFCGLCLYCGLRKEEALGLQWQDIASDRLTVNRTTTFLNNQPDPVQDLKTDASHRTIPIPSDLQRILNVSPRIGKYVVCTCDGKQMTAIAFRNLWGQATKNSVLHVHPHMLRHTYATMLYHAGIDLRTAQHLLGHATIQMTAKIYTHLDTNDAMKSLELINKQFARRPKNEAKSSQKVVKAQNE